MKWIKVIAVLLSSVTFACAEGPATGKTAADNRGVKFEVKAIDNRKRVALIIGNSNYISSPLKNPVNDAKSMASTLRQLGFEVEEKTDLNYVQLNKSVETFGKKLTAGGVGLFYYAGHGMQVNGANYLIPVDAEIEDENEVRYKAVDAGLVLAKMEQARGDVNIIVLDACRNNPFARSFRSASRGLASMDAPTGSILAYATAPGRVAIDGLGKNGVYTEELIKVLETPGLNVEQSFKRVRKAVMERTANAQVPWESSSLVGDFHFIPPAAMTDLQPAALPPVVVQPVPVQPNVPEAKLLDGKDTFTVSDTTITEKNGLIWWRDAFYKNRKMNFMDARSAIESMNNAKLEGCQTWRFPFGADLNRLRKYAAKAGFISETGTIEYLDSIGFKNVKPDYYWLFSMTPNPAIGNSPTLDLETGRAWSSPVSDELFVWPVCAPQK